VSVGTYPAEWRLTFVDGEHVLAVGQLATGFELESGFGQRTSSTGGSERRKMKTKDSHLSQTRRVHDPYLDMFWEQKLVGRMGVSTDSSWFVVVMECAQSALLVYLWQWRTIYLSTAMSL
jgi:hypothetical protein